MATDPIAAVKAARRKLERREAKVADAWRELEDAIVAASDAGASYSTIGDALELSKQRIGELAQAGRARTA